MKTNLKFLTIIAFLGVFLNSCSSDDDGGSLNAPVISDFEYGEGSSHSTDQVAYKGSDIHIEADINAEAVVSSITLSIHAHDLTPSDGEEDWDFEQVFTDEKYLVINPTFHEHIDVPTDIPAGEYHIELLVTDELGNSTEVDGHIQILDPITLSDFSIDETAVRGDDFHTEFAIEAVNGIHNITVDVHAHGLTPAEGEEEWDEEFDFSEDYHEETSVEFHEHIEIPATAPVGEYHIIFTVEDENGNTAEYETHIDITA
ncbi:protein containing PKD domain-containing protein [Seonamhaeicola sp. S2-3]|uniref:DUF4625 domain-containing protein n=1 Tax=Seonamhaeicola sp. S2-3 TaxID=1936081 RepID=UPI0009726916|nr:DUF4625 domain-containing protein [Seonamhaeicola sp. S2-3]APY12717.1 protein containing PKD domain-containing protein [Seonamhaeicola sp. S2-3]